MKQELVESQAQDERKSLWMAGSRTCRSQNRKIELVGL